MNDNEKYQDIIGNAKKYYDSFCVENPDAKVALRWCSLNYKENTNGHVERYEPGASICEEINLWTYWQGRNFLKQFEVKRIKYLVVGQDWERIK